MTFSRSTHVALCLLVVLTTGQASNFKICKGENSSNLMTGPDIQVQNEMISTIVHLIQTLEWKHIILLYHQQSYSIVQELLLQQDYEVQPASFILQELDQELMSGSAFRAFLQSVHQKLFPELKFILLTDYLRGNQLLKIVDVADAELNRTTDFRHYSFWIQACTSVCQPPSGPHPGIHHLENVILLSPSQAHGKSIWSLHVGHQGRYFSHLRMPITADDTRNIFVNTIFGLNYRTLVVASLSNKGTNLFFTKTKEGYGGYCFEIIQYLASALNFSYEILEPADREWGSLINGTWNGLVGQLERREIDMVVAPLTIHEDRERVMDFLYPPFKTSVDGFAYMVPPEDTVRWKIYLRTFRPEVLYVVLATLTVFTFLAYLMMKFRENEMSTYTRGNPRQSYKVSKLFLYVTGLIIKQGSTMEVWFLSTRILFCTWGIFGVVLAGAYSSNLVAGFAVHEQPLPFKSLAELVRQKEYKWGTIGGSIREHILRMSKDRDMQLAWEGMLEFNKTDPEVLSKSVLIHTEKLIREKYVFFAYKHYLDTIKEYDCRLKVIGEGLPWHQLGVGVPTGYPLGKDIERVLSSMADSGLLKFWWTKWLKRSQENCVKDNRVSPIRIQDVLSAFYILCVGFGLAVLVLLTEKIRKRC